MGKVKPFIMMAIGIVVMFTLIAAFIPTIITSYTTINATQAPTIVHTIANLWWIPIVLILVGTVTAAVGGGRIKRAFRGRSRRRR